MILTMLGMGVTFVFGMVVGYLCEERGSTERTRMYMKRVQTEQPRFIEWHNAGHPGCQECYQEKVDLIHRLNDEHKDHAEASALVEKDYSAKMAEYAELQPILRN